MRRPSTRIRQLSVVARAQDAVRRANEATAEVAAINQQSRRRIEVLELELAVVRGASIDPEGSTS
jgi:hypothetical protein